MHAPDLARPHRQDVGAVPPAPDDAWNRTLVSNVHPPDWINPEPANRYHLVVIGAGTAGLVSASAAAGLGGKVALVERGLMGGDCLNFGCVPSKALLRAARAVAGVRRAGEYGVTPPPNEKPDFPAIMQRMRRLRARISAHDSATRFRDMGVDVFLGDARFTGTDTAEVNGRTLRFRRAVIATGSRAATLPIAGLEEVGYLTNETVFSLTALPARLAVIGAGPIGCELAQAFARFGSEVTLIDVASQMLPREESAAAEHLQRALVRDGVRLLLDAKVLEVRSTASGKQLVVERQGERSELPTDALLVAVGRKPNLEDLGLDSAGVAHDRAGITVDDFLRTTSRRVYAAGDVASAYKFTHAADAMARACIQNAFFSLAGLGRRRASRLVIPWCTYTDPEIAHVGVTAQEASERGIEVRSFRVGLEDVDRAVLDGEEEGYAEILVRAGSDRIVGATIVAAHAGELIGQLSLAMTHRLGLSAFSATIYPYPTQAECLKRLGDAYQRSRLTPRAAAILKRILHWRR